MSISVFLRRLACAVLLLSTQLPLLAAQTSGSPVRLQAGHPVQGFSPEDLLVIYANLRAELARGPVHIALCGSELGALLTPRTRSLITRAPYWEPASRIEAIEHCEPTTSPKPPYPTTLRVLAIRIAEDSAYVDARSFTAWDGKKFRGARATWLTERLGVKDFAYPKYTFSVTGWDLSGPH